MDYKNGNIHRLFIKQLIPNLLGMAFTALFVIVDGIFVGRGVGSDALAAVNIVGALFTFMTGVGLMFGMGGAIIATIYLSKRKRKAANVIVTQSFAASVFVMLLFTATAFLFPREFTVLLGAPEGLVELASEYLRVLSLFSVFQTTITALPFFVRISNPNYSLICLSVATVLNLVLDYVFIFIFHWGLAGAAFATGIGEVVASGMLIYYLIKFPRGVRFTRLKLSFRHVAVALRNIGAVMKLGVSVLLSELTISVMAIAGNYAFGRYIGISGIAAFSVINYMFPVIYMVFNAIIQSSQPIISYNYGLSYLDRSRKAVRLALLYTLGVGMLFVLVSLMFGEQLVSLFIPDRENPAWMVAVRGLPYFSLDFIFFGINVLAIGYYMSVEKTGKALLVTVIRGLLPVICFLLIPLWLGIKGLWLSVPVGEIITTLLLLLTIAGNKFKSTYLCTRMIK